MNFIQKAAFNAAKWVQLRLKPVQNFIVTRIRPRPPQAQRWDLERWRNALLVAETSGQRSQLYDLYSDICRDGTLVSIIEQRVEAVKGLQFAFRAKDQQPNEIVDKWLKTTQFKHLVHEIMHAILYGCTVVQIDDTLKTTLIQRKHVKPELGIITVDAHDTTGQDYREWVGKSIVEVNHYTQYGLLLMVAALIILKRGGVSDWAAFVELFGSPTIFAKYQNEATRLNLTDQLEIMGGRGKIVAPQDATLDFHEHGTNSNGDLFNALRKAMNEEIAITILGSAMTTIESSMGGYSQAKIHGDKATIKTISDTDFVLCVLNEQVIPILQFYGIISDGEFIVPPAQMSLDDKLKVVKMAFDTGVASPEWICEQLGIQQEKQLKTPKVTKKEQKEQEKQLKLSIESSVLEWVIPIPKPLIGLGYGGKRQYFDDLAGSVWNGNLDISSIHSHIYDVFVKDASQGLTRNIANTTDLNYLESDAKLRRNLSDFASGKARLIASDLAAAKAKYSEKNSYDMAAKAIIKRHRQWFYTESQAVTMSCISTRDMERFAARQDVSPNLILLTVGDGRVRDDHAAQHGVCKPFNDPHWKTHTPPMGWFCRCTLQSTNKPVTTGEVASNIKRPKGLQHRMYDSGIVYGDGSPETGEPHAYLEKLPKKVANKLQTASEMPQMQSIAFENSEFASKTGQEFSMTVKTIDRILTQNHSNSALRNVVLAHLFLILPELEVIENATEFAILGQIFKILFDNNELISIE